MDSFRNTVEYIRGEWERNEESTCSRNLQVKREINLGGCMICGECLVYVLVCAGNEQFV